MIRAVFFDLDGTLYDRDRLVAELFEAQYDSFSPELRGLSREKFLREVTSMDDHGYGMKESGYGELVCRWGLDSTLGQRLIQHFWDTYDGHCRLASDVRHALEQLHARGLKLAVITNGNGVRQRRKIEALGLTATFDAILVSEEEGVRKPDVEIFRRALDRCGVTAPQTLFVGDHPTVDIQGAHQAGLIAVWKRVPYWPSVVTSAQFIDGLSDLIPICDRYLS